MSSLGCTLAPYLRRLAKEREKLKKIHTDRVKVLFKSQIEDCNIIKQDPIDTDTLYDLVYIVKEGEINPDLRMSLRSVSKFCKYRKIWIIGYKPSWVQNVEYIHTEQTGNKWKNSMVNYTTACTCPDISDNFILMNDDFFAIKQITNWEENTNVYLGTLLDEIKRYSKTEKKSRWQYAFSYAEELLTQMNCKNQFNYESHWPILINKKDFLEFLNRPEIKEFQNTKKVLHKRSVYRNLYPTKTVENQRLIKDVKIPLGRDLTKDYLNECWLSVFDDVTDNWRNFPKLNGLLYTLFPDPCQYEKE